MGIKAQTEGALSGYNPEFKSSKKSVEDDELLVWGLIVGVRCRSCSGLCFGSIGTDTGGSVLVAFNGKWRGWFKARFTVHVSRYGVVQVAQTLDHVGPLARRASKDGAISFDAISGRDALDPTSLRQDLAPTAIVCRWMWESMTLGVDSNYIEKWN